MGHHLAQVAGMDEVTCRVRAKEGMHQRWRFLRLDEVTCRVRVKEAMGLWVSELWLRQ